LGAAHESIGGFLDRGGSCPTSIPKATPNEKSLLDKKILSHSLRDPNLCVEAKSKAPGAAMKPKDQLAEDAYTIEPLSHRGLIVRFAKFCNHTRTTAHEKQLTVLVGSYARIACDVSQTQYMSSDWMRWLCRMPSKPASLGKEFGYGWCIKKLLRER